MDIIFSRNTLHKFIFVFLLVPISHADEARFQNVNNILFLVSENNTYEYVNNHFVRQKSALPYDSHIEPNLSDGGFNRTSKIDHINVGSGLVEDNCRLVVDHRRKFTAAGSVSCNFFGEMQSVDFELNHKEILYPGDPHISYDNYIVDDKYYINIAVSQHMDERSIAHAIFSKDEIPQLVVAPLDCSLGFSDMIFTRAQQSVCRERLGSGWYALENKKPIELAAPCNNPEQLVGVNENLWGLQRDSLNQFHLCKYSRSLISLEQHFLYEIDITKTLEIGGLPSVNVNRIYATHKEAEHEDDRPIGYDFYLESPIKVQEETENTVLIDGHTAIRKSDRLQLFYSQNTDVDGISHKLLEHFEIRSLDVVFKITSSDLKKYD